MLKFRLHSLVAPSLSHFRTLKLRHIFTILWEILCLLYIRNPLSPSMIFTSLSPLPHKKVIGISVNFHWLLPHFLWMSKNKTVNEICILGYSNVFKMSFFIPSSFAAPCPWKIREKTLPHTDREKRISSIIIQKRPKIPCLLQQNNTKNWAL